MSFWISLSILRFARKFTLLSIVGMTISSCTYKRLNQSMDISEIIGKRKQLESFIHGNFNSIEYNRNRSPILLYNVNFINKTDRLTFCNMNIQQCWVKKRGELYAFFMIIKTSADIERYISAKYGKWDTKGSISIADTPLGGDIITWSMGEVKIDVSSYPNAFNIPKYELCDLVICGNMTLKQLLDLPEN
jgi:hypothetical protein